jgi:hypothetical protein
MTDLCILANVKEWLRTGADPLPTTDDAMLARLITAASAFVESWLSRPIGLANWQEVRDGMGGERANRMVLAVTPVVAVQSLTIDRIAIQPVPPLQPAPPSAQPGTFSSTAGYLFTPTELVLRGFRFERGTANVVVQYTAGYYPIPADLEQATIELVVRKYRERTRIAERSRSLGGTQTVSYSTVTFSMNSLATDVQVLLSKYQQVAPLLRATLLPSSPADDPMLVGVIV